MGCLCVGFSYRDKLKRWRHDECVRFICFLKGGAITLLLSYYHHSVLFVHNKEIRLLFFIVIRQGQDLKFG